MASTAATEPREPFLSAFSILTESGCLGATALVALETTVGRVTEGLATPPRLHEADDAACTAFVAGCAAPHAAAVDITARLAGLDSPIFGGGPLGDLGDLFLTGGPRLAEAASLGARPLQPGISPAASTRRPLAVPTSLPPSTIPVECLPLQDNIAALVVGALPQPVPPLAEAALRADAPDPAAPLAVAALVVLALVDVASELPLRVPVIAGPHGAHAAGLLAQREAVPIPPGMPSLLVLLAVALRLPPLAVLHGRLNLRPVDHKPLRLVVVAPLDTLLAVAGLRAAAREPGDRPAIPTLDALPISAPAFVHPADGDSTHEGTPAPVFGHFKLQLVDTFASTGLLTLGPVVPTPVTILVAAVAPRFPVGADICDFLPVVGFTHRLLCVAALGAAAGAGCCDQGVLLHLLLVLSDVGLGALHAVGSLRLLG